VNELPFTLHTFTASRPRVMLETASIAGGAVAALFLAAIVGFCKYVRTHQDKKRADQESVEANGHHNGGVDTVDGPAAMTAVCCCQQSQQVVHSSSQLSSNLGNEENGDGSLQHPQFCAAPHLHRPLPASPTMRPFGPHHYQPISMSDVLMKRSTDDALMQ